MTSHDLADNMSKWYTRPGLQDNLFLDLCRAKISTNIPGRAVDVSVIIPDKNGDKQITVNKYFDIARRNTLKIMIGHPVDAIVIDDYDIRPEILNELKTTHPFVRQNIIKQSMLKIFEITSPLNCYHSIAPRLKVVITGL